MGDVVMLKDRPCARHRPNSGQAQGRLGRILLAYPGSSKREYLAIFLASRGYEVTACGNGKEALAHLAAGRFELVVSGIVMPHMDGLELVRALRRHNGPPVIAVTDGSGKMDRIYLRSAILCGAVAAHTFCEAGGALLTSADWILRGRDDVTRDVVW
jgi:CheY-like chemotaxis protein